MAEIYVKQNKKYFGTFVRRSENSDTPFTMRNSNLNHKQTTNKLFSKVILHNYILNKGHLSEVSDIHRFPTWNVVESSKNIYKM